MRTTSETVYEMLKPFEIASKGWAVLSMIYCTLRDLESDIAEFKKLTEQARSDIARVVAGRGDDAQYTFTPSTCGVVQSLPQIDNAARRIKARREAIRSMIGTARVLGFWSGEVPANEEIG